LCLALAACARLGERVERTPLPEGAPAVQQIVDGLAANDASIANFKAKGALRLESPDLAAVETCDDGTIAFRRPADLCVIGRKLVFGVTAFRLTCVGSAFIIEFPATKDDPYYSLEGERFAGVPFSVSPSDIAREMFLPESWSELNLKEIRLVAYSSADQTGTIEIGPKRAPRRRIVVTGPPWVVVRSERLDKDGAVLAVTSKTDYREVDGVLFPANVDALFPGEQTRMTLEMRKIWPNTKLNESLFNINARARELGLDMKQPPSTGPSHDRKTKRPSRRP
jgi:hypothetical protein